MHHLADTETRRMDMLLTKASGVRFGAPKGTVEDPDTGKTYPETGDTPFSVYMGAVNVLDAWSGGWDGRSAWMPPPRVAEIAALHPHNMLHWTEANLPRTEL